MSDQESFSTYLSKALDKDTIGAVEKIFEKLGLPVPEEGAFFQGAEGAIVFLDDLGLVLRIEPKQPVGWGERVLHPLILQPLILFDAINAVVEICPGLERGDSGSCNFLRRFLKTDRIDFWDDLSENTGVIPIKLPGFPNGVPVVIDRLAVEKLSKAMVFVRKVLDAVKWWYGNIDLTCQDRFYKPLREAFERAVTPAGEIGPNSLKEAWDLCREFKAQGKLVSSWTEQPDDGEYQKSVSSAGRAYKKQLENSGF